MSYLRYPSDLTRVLYADPFLPSFEMVDDGDRLLVIGTTLATYSAFRYVLEIVAL